MHVSFQALGNRTCAAEKLIQCSEGGFRRRFFLTEDLCPEIVQERLRTFSQFFRPEFWRDRRDEPQNHTSNGGMYSGTQDCCPEEKAHNDVYGDRSATHGNHDEERQQTARCRQIW